MAKRNITCPVCGRSFTPWRQKKFCSERCRKTDQNRRLGYVRRDGGTALADGSLERAKRTSGLLMGVARSSEARPIFLYVIKAVDGHMLKIGISHDTTERLAQLRREGFTGLTVHWQRPCTGYARRAERYMHKMLHHHQLEGEWFTCPPELAVREAVRFCVRTDAHLKRRAMQATETWNAVRGLAARPRKQASERGTAAHSH